MKETVLIKISDEIHLNITGIYRKAELENGISEEFEIENIESIQNNLFNVLEWVNMEKYYLEILEEKCLEKIKE